jgi:hypothetical protein
MRAVAAFADAIDRGYLAGDFADAFARYLGPRVYTPYEDMQQMKRRICANAADKRGVG